MAHFTRTRADLAAWTASSIVTAAEFNDFDEKIFKSVNGDEGGTWAPSSQIEFGGAGLLVSGDFDVSGASQISGSANFTGLVTINSPGALTCNVASLFQNTVDFNNDVTMGNSESDVFNLVATGDFDGPVGFDGQVDFNADVDVNSSFTFEASSTANFLGGINVLAPMLFANNGRIRSRIQLVQSDSNIVVLPTIDHLIIDHGFMTQQRVVTIDDSFALDGDSVTIHNHDDDWTLIVTSSSAPIQYGFVATNQSNLFAKHGGSWIRVTQIS